MRNQPVSQHNLRSLVFSLLVAIAIVLAMARAAVADPPSDLQLVEVISGVNNPVAIRNADDGSGRLFIVERGGQIKIWDGNQILNTPFLDISGTAVSPSLISGGEQGLLGLAFHPNFAGPGVGQGFFYINYTRGQGSGETAIVRRQVSAGNPNVAETRGASIKQIIVINQDQTNHNGGDIHFGPNDGYLYVGMGDGGSGGDPGCRAQHINNLLGNMLRLDVDTPGDLAAYEIPDDNPFDDETWAYGLRNPWRWSFDRFTGDLFIGDVGQVTREEISFQPAGSPGGENYGWKVMEGNYCHDPNPIDPSCPGGTPSCGSGSYTPPLFDYTRSLGQAVAGGFRYRGSKLSGFHGTYVYGDHSTGRIWFANQNNQGQWSTSVWMDTNYSISSFGEDEEGELYLAHKTGSGKIYRFESAGSVFTDGFEAGDTSVWSEVNP